MITDDYHKAEVQRRKELEQRSARMWLLDDKLYDLYKNDPYVNASLKRYIHGEMALEKCLIDVIEALLKNRDEMLISKTIKIGDVK